MGGMFSYEYPHGKSPFGSSSTAEDIVKQLPAEEVSAALTGKSVLITGPTIGGLGFETARVLYGCGLSHLILAGRSKDALAAAEAELRKVQVADGAPAPQLLSVQLDLGDLDSIRAAAKQIQESGFPLHILINNAGVMACPLSRTKQNMEMQIGCNHFGHFLLTNLLLELMARSVKQVRNDVDPNYVGRVVILSSSGHQMGTINFEDMHYRTRSYSAWGAYGQSKLANILMAKELSRRFEEAKLPLVANALHPGVIHTNLGRHMSSWMMTVGNVLGGFFYKSIPQGAATTVWVATSAEMAKHSGGYCADCNMVMPNASARDQDVAARLWEVSERETDCTYPDAALKKIFA